MALSGSLNFLSASLTGSENDGAIINVDFVGLNTLVHEPMTASSNFLGYDSSVDQSQYVIGQNSRGNRRVTDFAPYRGGDLNSLLIHRNGPYQHPTWKQIRGSEHPIARNLRLSNTMSIDFNNAIGQNTTQNPASVLRQKLYEDHGPHGNGFHAALDSTNIVPNLKYYYEPAVVSKYKPMIYSVDLPGQYGGKAIARQTVTNEVRYFINSGLNEILNVSDGDPSTGSHESRGTPNLGGQERYLLLRAAKSVGAQDFVISETIFPRAVNTYRDFKLKRPFYEETGSHNYSGSIVYEGKLSNGFDRVRHRSFWRTEQGSYANNASSSTAPGTWAGGGSFGFNTFTFGDGTTRARSVSEDHNNSVVASNIVGGGVKAERLGSCLNSQGFQQNTRFLDPLEAFGSGAMDPVLAPVLANQSQSFLPIPLLAPGGHASYMVSRMSKKWTHTASFIANGIVTNRLNILSGTKDNMGNVDIQPSGCFAQLDAYQPYPISLTSMWPLDARNDLYNITKDSSDAGDGDDTTSPFLPTLVNSTHKYNPAHLTSSAGGAGFSSTAAIQRYGALMIGLTPHSPSASAHAELGDRTARASDLSPYRPVSGSVYDYTQRMMGANMTTRSAGELVYSTKPTIFYYRNATAILDFTSMTDDDNYGDTVATMVVMDTKGNIVHLDFSLNVAYNEPNPIVVDTVNKNVIGISAGNPGTRTAGTAVATPTRYRLAVENAINNVYNQGLINTSASITRSVVYNVSSSAYSVVRLSDVKYIDIFPTGTVGPLTLHHNFGDEPILGCHPQSLAKDKKIAIYRMYLQGYEAPTASLQYHRHTYPYNSPFYVTNRIGGSGNESPGSTGMAVQSRDPMFNSYDEFIGDKLRYLARDHSLVPEFRVSDHYDYYSSFYRKYLYSSEQGKASPVYKIKKGYGNVDSINSDFPFRKKIISRDVSMPLGPNLAASRYHKLDFLTLDGAPAVTSSSPLTKLRDELPTKNFYEWDDIFGGVEETQPTAHPTRRWNQKLFQADREDFLTASTEFFAKYSHTDKLESFADMTDQNNEGFESDVNTVPETITFVCSAVKKLLPYNGFYPMLRTVQIGSHFSAAFGPHLKSFSATSFPIPTTTAEQARTGRFQTGSMADHETGKQAPVDVDFSIGLRHDAPIGQARHFLDLSHGWPDRDGGGAGDTMPQPPFATKQYDSVVHTKQAARLQAILEPFMAPGILYNSIKSGLAVDYPIYTASTSVYCPTDIQSIDYFSQSFGYGGYQMMGAARAFPAILGAPPSERLPFEALYDPEKIILQDPKGKDAKSNYLISDFVDLDRVNPDSWNPWTEFEARDTLSRGKPWTDAQVANGAMTTTQADAYLAEHGELPGTAKPRRVTHGYSPNAYIGKNPVSLFKQAIRIPEYERSINNFLAESMEFFLDDQSPGVKMPVIASKPLEKVQGLKSGDSYYFNLNLKMGEDHVQCEGPRRSGFIKKHDGASRASVTIFFSTAAVLNSTITLQSTDGTLRKYVADDDGGTAYVDGDPDFTGGGTAPDQFRFHRGNSHTGETDKSRNAALALAAAITSSFGHGAAFEVRAGQTPGTADGELKWGFVEITQAVAGTAGNTAITTADNFTNAMTGTVPAAFSGGDDFPIQSTNTIRGYLYGPPIEVAPVSGTATLPKRPGKIYDHLGARDLESYFGANLQDPAYQAYTPPYFYGDSSYVFKYTNTEFAVGEEMTVQIPELLESIKKTSYHLEGYNTTASLTPAIPATSSISQGTFTRMKIDSSIDVFNWTSVQSGENFEHEEHIWYMNPKWVCPVLDFSSSYSAVRRLTPTSSISLAGASVKEKQLAWVTNSYHDDTTGRGMWGGYGTDPYDVDAMQLVYEVDNLNSSEMSKGIIFDVTETFPEIDSELQENPTFVSDVVQPGEAFMIDSILQADNTGSLLAKMGFEGQSFEIGRMARSKEIAEAIAIIPYFDNPISVGLQENTPTLNEEDFEKVSDLGDTKGIFLPGDEIFKTREIIPGRHFLPIHKTVFENILTAKLADMFYEEDSETRKNLQCGAKSDVAAALNTDVGTLINQLVGDRTVGRKGFQLPPEFDFIHNAAVDPFQMMIIPVEHTLDSQDMIDIYQGLMPDISLNLEKAIRSVVVSPAADVTNEEIVPKIYFADQKEVSSASMASLSLANFLSPNPILNAETLLEESFDKKVYIKKTGLVVPSDPTNDTYSAKDFYKNLRFMVFKIKQRAEKDYKVYKERQIAMALKNRIVDQDEDKKRRLTNENGRFRTVLSNVMSSEVYGTNWPYDYFSLVEAIKLDVQIKVKE